MIIYAGAYIFLYKHFNSLGTVIFVFIMGFGLFFIKCQFIRYYGLLELLIAASSIYFFMESTSLEHERAYATLFSHLATIYIIVRGFDNIFDDVQKKKLKKWVYNCFQIAFKS